MCNARKNDDIIMKQNNYFETLDGKEYLLISSKSILDCSYDEEEIQHCIEVSNIIGMIQELSDIDCSVLIRFSDVAHKEKEHIVNCTMGDFITMLENSDFKNGIDFGIDDIGRLIAITYGQGYMLNDDHHMIINHFYIKSDTLDFRKHFYHLTDSHQQESLIEEVMSESEEYLRVMDLVNLAIESGVLIKGENGGVVVVKNYTGHEVVEEIDIHEAVRDLINQDEVSLIESALEQRNTDLQDKVLDI